MSVVTSSVASLSSLASPFILPQLFNMVPCYSGQLAGPASMNQAEQKKKLANDTFQAKNFKEAVALYGEAIDMAGDGAPATYFSNWAVAWAALGEWQHARNDTEQAIQRPKGITAKTLFHKVRAELKLEDVDPARQ